MQNLTVIENELVPVYETNTGEKVVYGSELHEVLGVKSRYREWIDRRLTDIDAVEYEDFEAAEISAPSGQTKKDHIIKLDTAKEMAMLERNEKGKQVRRYFIQVEKKFKENNASKKIPSKNKKHTESLSAVNNAVKILTPMLAAAGCDSKIQLLTAKSLYEKADVTLPVMIEADQQYFDTVHIARQVGIYYQSSGKPADKAVNEIIRRLNIPQSMYTETWESKGKWQGTVRKYASEVITMVRSWYAENGYPRDIEYVQSDGQKKTYHVIWRESEVA